MQEVRDDFADGLFVVDEGLQDLCGAACGNKVVVSDGGGYEAGTTFGKEDAVLCASYPYLTIAPQIHDDDEGVVLDHVAVEGACGLDDLDAEMWGVQQYVGNIDVITVLGLVVGIDGEVNGLGSQFGMELAGLAVKTRTVIVEDAVGDIGGLLYLDQTDAATDGMDTTGRKVEDIALVDFMFGKDLGDGAVVDTLLIFLWRYLLPEAGIEAGTGLGIEDVPHLGLSGFMVLTLCHLVVGMYLYGEVLLGIDDLGEQGQLVVVSLCHGFPKTAMG